MTRHLNPRLLLATAIGLMLVSVAPAGTITFTDTATGTHGTGFGNVYNLLTVHATGQQTTEFGSVLWNGTNRVLNTGPGTGGNATNQSTTQSASVVAGRTLNNEFGLIFNINQPGNNSSVSLHDFSLRFQNPAGNTLFDLTYHAPAGGLTLPQAGNGTGASGWLFHVDLTPTESAEFFASSGNQLGEFITQGNAITNAAGGAENSFLQSSSGSGTPPPQPPPVVPEPASLFVWLTMGLAGLGVGIRSLRKRT